MKLIKFPSPNLTNNSNKTDISLPYQEWEIEEIIENLSEDEQDLLIEKISTLAQEWELTLDAELELSLQTKYKESKTSLNYTDWLYDLAQEEVYRAYAIEQLDKQKNKTSIAQTEAATPTTTATTPTDSVTTAITNSIDNLVDRNALTNKPNIDSNSPLNEEELINQIIENLSEAQQDVLMEKTVLLLDEWESTRDKGLELALRTQHQKHQSHISYQDFLYELAQSQVYREYAVKQLELAKQNNAKFIGQFVEIEKIYCDKLTNVHPGNVDEPIFDELIFNELIFNEPIFGSASQVAKDESSVQLLDANNDIIINDELTAKRNSDTFIREKSIFTNVSQVANETAANEKSLDCHQRVSNSQGHPERITSLKDCASYHITRALSKGCNFSIKSISHQTRYLSSIAHYSKNTLSLIKANKALLMPINQGTLTKFSHPPSLPP